jgi:subtilisin family serine protease
MKFGESYSPAVRTAMLSARIVWVICVLFAFTFGVLGQDNAARARFRSDRILVKPKAQHGRAAMANLHNGLRTRVLRTFQSLDGVQLLSLAPGVSVEETIQKYQASAMVEYAEPDYWVQASAEPNDPKYADGTLWGLNNTGRSGGIAGADIKAVGAWAVRTSAPGVIVAVIDTGVRYTHEDLSPNMWVNTREIRGNGIDDDGNGYVDDVYGINAVDNTGNPLDDAGHGTHVAGIIGAVGDNGLGVVGVAWNVQIMALKFMDSTGMGSHSDAVQCIDYARNNGAQVINASWGSGGSSTTLRSAISRARTAGIIFVAASGNESQNDDLIANYPSGYDLDNIVSVASSTRSDGLSDFSNYGARSVDVLAPGSTIYSTWYSSDRSYSYNSGTSMAAPYVAGALALMRAHFPNETYKQLIDRLFAATDSVASLSEKCLTGGRMNVERALSSSLLANFSVSRTSGAPPLTVAFQNSSVGSVAKYHWDFGDRTTSAEANPSHIYTTAGSFTATLTVTSSSGVTSKKSKVITALGNYQMVGAPFEWIEPSAMTRVTLADNGVSTQLLPFIFQFYGQGYDRVFVGANGIIGFVNQGLTTTSNANLPSTSLPNAMLCPYWDNLNPSAGGAVYFGVIGEQPSRRAVISWVDVPRNSTSAALTFQTVLDEGSDQIRFQYLDTQPQTSRGGGKAATIGVENDLGTIAAKFTYDGNPIVLTNRQTILFVPANQDGFSIAPSSALVASGKAGGPFSPNVWTVTIENRGSTQLRWAVSKTQPWLTLSATNGLVSIGQRSTILVSLSSSAASLAPGSYSDLLSFINLDGGSGNTTRTVTLDVDGNNGVLAISPEMNLFASGNEGGPFTPSSQVYTLVNNGDARLDWTVGAKAPWVTLSSTGGTLSAGGSATVTVRLNELASLLPVGKHSDFVFFANTTTGIGTDIREVSLDVRAAPQARLAVSNVSLDGRFRFSLTGESGRTYLVQVSDDLAGWSIVSTNTAEVDGTFEFIEPVGERSLRKFYRAISQ